MLVPEGCVEGLSQFARDLCQRQEAGTCGQWRKLSPSAELMVDPGCGARCAIRDTGAPGEGRYHWTVTVFEETGPAAEGYTGELAEARSRAEEALGAYFAVSANDPWTDADAPHSPPKHLANPSAATPELKATNKTTSAPFLPQSNLVGSH